MMKAYPEYKKSNFTWLGKVPSHWSLKKVAWDMPFVVGWTPSTKEEKYFEGENIWVSIADMKSKGITDSKKKISNVAISDKGISIVTKGSLLFSFKLSVGKVGFAKKDLYTNEAIASFTKNEKVYLPFLYYAAPLFLPRYGQENIYGALLMNQDRINSAKTFMPDYEEQKKIADYLDIEINKIDNIICEKQNFIKLLSEKRQALISHVVTKGLNSNVGVKDSGVEWIGEIPKHWDVTKLRYLGKCQNGINIDGDAFGSGYPFISYGDVYNNKALPSKVKGLVQSTAQDREIYSVKSGDILFTRTSETIDEIGFTSVCHNDMDNAVFAGFLIRFRPKENAIDPLYSEYYFQNEKLRAFFVKEMNLVTRASLSQELLKRMPVTIPPVEEQKEIAEYISNKDKLISELANEAKNSIELLKEHRTALISAAVTGKIDVREVA